MLRWIAIGAFLFMIAVTTAFSIYVFNAREKYEKAHALSKSLDLVEMNVEAQAFLDDVRTNWKNQSGFFEADGLILAEFGLAPTVANWVEAQTWKMPRFSYWNLHRNRRNAKFGFLQANLLLISEDGNVYVTADRSLAYVRMEPNMVYLFENRPEGLRQAIYVLSRP